MKKPIPVPQASSLCTDPTQTGRMPVLHPHSNVPQASSLCSPSEKSHTSKPPPDSGYFDPRQKMETSRRNLPHWRQEDSWCFLTYCLSGSLPQHVLSSLKCQREHWLRDHPKPWSSEEAAEYRDHFGNRIDELLDAGSGACWLRQGEVRSLVVSALHYHENRRYTLDAWAIMPNHVHVLLKPRESHEVEKILHSWKSFTANQINRLLQRSGSFWQEESYDHLVRNRSAFWRIREYILQNPVKANLREGEYSTSADGA